MLHPLLAIGDGDLGREIRLVINNVVDADLKPVRARTLGGHDKNRVACGRG
jgi:hypothetical protein